jgi:hypothetical protein
MAQDIFANSPEIDLRKRYALSLLQQSTDASPARHPLQAVARALQGAIGGYMGYQAQQDDKAAGDAWLSSLPGVGNPTAQPNAAPQTPATQPTAPTQQKSYNDAIAGIESGGKYDLLGPVTKTGDRAYGKYQVMGANVPEWTRAYAGKEMTPQQFIADPQAQDAVFNGRFGEYAKKYGPEGAAKAWFAGEGGMNNPNARDQLGTTVAQYAQKFTAGMGGNPNAANLPGTPQPNAPVGNRSSVQIPPDVQAAIRQLGSDPRTRPQALQLYMQYAKPVEQIQPMSAEQRKQWNVPEGVSAGIDSVTGKPVFSQPANSVNVNTAANPVLEGVGKQLVDQRKNAQVAATQTIPAIYEARKALDEGATTGMFAAGKVNLQKLGSMFGLDASQAQNTEVLRSAIGGGVLAHIKELGANPSNADRDYIEKVQGGQISLEEGSIRRILDIQEKYARQAVRNFNNDAKKLMSVQGGDQAYKSIAPLMQLEEPGPYTPPEKKAATQAAPQAAPQAQQPVKVSTPDEARKLPSGTPILLPDGSVGRVP